MTLRMVHRMGAALAVLALLTTPTLAQRGGGRDGGGRGGGGFGGPRDGGGNRGGGVFRGGNAPRGNLGSVPSFSRPSVPNFNRDAGRGPSVRSVPQLQTPRQSFGQSAPDQRRSLQPNRPDRLPNAIQPPTNRSLPGNVLNRPDAVNRPGIPGRNNPGQALGNTINRGNDALNNRNLPGPNRVNVSRPDAFGNRINLGSNNNVDARFGNSGNFNNRFGNQHPQHWNPYRYNGWNRGNWNVWGPGFAFNNFNNNRYGYGYGRDYGWNGNNGRYGRYGWYNRPWGPWAAIGLTSWALGGLYYNTGYGAYVNPYYGGGADYVYNYSQPIAYVVSGDSGVTQAPPDDSAAAFQAAREAFRNGDYQTALQYVDQAITKNPNDPSLHEFRGVTLFALQRYPEASAAVYAVLSVGPGMNWPSLLTLYPSVETYTPQLRALEASVRQNPNEPNGHFLLAYQYMTAGHTDAARRQFQKASELAPNDAVSRQMIRLLTPPEANATENAAVPATESNRLPPAAPPTQSSTPVLSQPVGSYEAAAGNEGRITLNLRDDGTFLWNVKQGDNPREFTGKYTLEGSTLALEFQDGGGMVGTVEPKGNGFHFAVIDGPPNDPGLDFARR